VGFHIHGNHLFKEFVNEQNYPSLNIYGLIVSKKKLRNYPEITRKNLRMKQHKLLYPMLEEESETME
jgi:hypothetical protein